MANHKPKTTRKGAGGRPKAIRAIRTKEGVVLPVTTLLERLVAHHQYPEKVPLSKADQKTLEQVRKIGGMIEQPLYAARTVLLSEVMEQLELGIDRASELLAIAKELYADFDTTSKKANRALHVAHLRHMVSTLSQKYYDKAFQDSDVKEWVNVGKLLEKVMGQLLVALGLDRPDDPSMDASLVVPPMIVVVADPQAAGFQAPDEEDLRKRFARLTDKAPAQDTDYEEIDETA